MNEKKAQKEQFTARHVNITAPLEYYGAGCFESQFGLRPGISGEHVILNV